MFLEFRIPDSTQCSLVYPRRVNLTAPTQVICKCVQIDTENFRSYQQTRIMTRKNNKFEKFTGYESVLLDRCTKPHTAEAPGTL